MPFYIYKSSLMLNNSSLATRCHCNAFTAVVMFTQSHLIVMQILLLIFKDLMKYLNVFFIFWFVYLLLRKDKQSVLLLVNKIPEIIAFSWWWVNARCHKLCSFCVSFSIVMLGRSNINWLTHLRVVTVAFNRMPLYITVRIVLFLTEDLVSTCFKIDNMEHFSSNTPYTVFFVHADFDCFLRFFFLVKSNLYSTA